MTKQSRQPQQELSSEQRRVESFIMQLPPERDKRFDKVWRNFAELAAIPRASGQEAEVSAFVQQRGELLKQRGLISEVTRDEANNITWTIPASAAMYDTQKASTLLQGHLDMVCQTVDTALDPAEHGVTPEVIKDDNEWRVQSKDNKTTLGADNGLMAGFLMALPELLRSQRIPHGSLKIIFTTNEEDGLTGAQALSPDTLMGYSQLINIDIEDEPEVTIGSAAIGNTVITLPTLREAAPSHLIYKQLNVSGLEGGHSGMTIGDNNRENAIKLATAILRNIPGIQISEIAANARLLNAIQKDASVVIGIPQEQVAALEESVRATDTAISGHEKATAAITLTDAEQPVTIVTQKSSRDVLDLLHNLPHGVKDYDPQDQSVVQTSTNLATAVLGENDTQLVIKHMSRSSFNDGLADMRQLIEDIATTTGAAIIQGKASPAWEPIRGSHLFNLLATTYAQLYPDRPPLHEAITHGGLETALFVVKAPHLKGNIVAIGPDLFGAHSVNETVSGPSVERISRLVLETIKTIATENAQQRKGRRSRRIEEPI